MQYLFWFIIAGFFALIAGTFYWSSLRRGGNPIELEKDLEEWICPTCGFQVQMGTECIYCEEKKPAD